MEDHLGHLLGFGDDSAVLVHMADASGGGDRGEVPAEDHGFVGQLVEGTGGSYADLRSDGGVLGDLGVQLHLVLDGPSEALEGQVDDVRVGEGGHAAPDLYEGGLGLGFLDRHPLVDHHGERRG